MINYCVLKAHKLGGFGGILTEVILKILCEIIFLGHFPTLKFHISTAYFLLVKVQEASAFLRGLKAALPHMHHVNLPGGHLTPAS